jgi:hypothetical protein
MSQHNNIPSVTHCCICASLLLFLGFLSTPAHHRAQDKPAPPGPAIVYGHNDAAGEYVKVTG